jgi:oligopeptide transport system permease protein
MNHSEPMITSDSFLPAERSESVQSLSRPSLSYWQDAWRRLRTNRQAIASLILIIALILFTTVGPFLWKKDSAEQDVSRISEPPSLGRMALVVDEAPSFETVEKTDFDPGTPADPSTLSAPANLRTQILPTTQSVRLEWEPVIGAETYAVYRSTTAPVDAFSLGLPLGELDSAKKVSYEDSFELKPGTFYYSVIAKSGGTEAAQYTTIKIDLKESLPISRALETYPSAKVGETIELNAHPLGTDYLGRDLLSRLMAGARVSLFIGFFAPFLSTLLGIMIGGLAGYLGGSVDAWLMRFTDFVIALPFLLFMILIKIAFGLGAGDSGVGVMLFALAILSWPGPARLIRGQILQLRESEFVQASRLLGAKPLYLILKHLLPNTLGVLLVSITFAVPSAIFAEAFLSFLGMGVVPPTPSWGAMANDGIQTFLNTPHEFLFPGILISITVLAFNLLGDGLRDALDPKMRGQQ